MTTKTQHRFSASTIAALLVVSVLLSIFVSMRASAAALSQVEVRFDRMKISEFTSGTVCAKPASTATEASVKVTFPTGYTVSTTNADWATSTTNLAWPAGASAWPSIGATSTSAAGQDVTWSSGDLTAGTLYCFNWTNSTTALQVKSGATSSNVGSVTTQTSAPAVIDTATYTTASITDDQIVVTATVPSTFSFAVNNNSDALGTLTAGSVTSSPTPRTVTVNTNAKNGWQVWAKSALTNGGLASSSASHTIPSNCSGGTGSNATLSGAAEGYNTGVTATIGSGATPSVSAVFDGTAQYQGGGLCGALQTLATSAGVATNAVLTLTNNVAIVGSTPAATDYTDTITVVGAGLF